MQIIFKQPDGKTFRAELQPDGRLTDIKPLDGGTPPAPMKAPGGSSAENEDNDNEEMAPDSGEPEKNLTQADKVFIEQLKSVLVNNRARKQIRHKQKGLLDSRAFVKTQTDSTSVFRQHNRKDSHRNYSVVLLVDESGSMSGQKARLAGELASAISTSLDCVEGVENAVLGFSDTRIVEHKRFDNTGHNTIHTIAHEGRSKMIEKVCRNGGGNADLIAMEYALEYLRKNAARDSKLVFVMLSDGAPSDAPSEIAIVTADMQQDWFRTKLPRTRDIDEMNRLIKRNPDINSFGLGMYEGGQQVPNHKVVENLADTKKELLTFLRGAIA